MFLRFRRSASIHRVVLKTLLGSFRTEVGDVSENVTLKRNSRFFQTVSAFIPVCLKCQKWANFHGVDFLGTALNFRKRKKIRRRLFASSIKREIMHFLVVIVQRQQRNVQEKYDARANLLFCLISLLLF